MLVLCVHMKMTNVERLINWKMTGTCVLCHMINGDVVLNSSGRETLRSERLVMGLVVFLVTYVFWRTEIELCQLCTFVINTLCFKSNGKSKSWIFYLG